MVQRQAGGPHHRDAAAQGQCDRHGRSGEGAAAELQKWIPSGIEFRSSPTAPRRSARASRRFRTLCSISIALVMAVVFVFLRRATPVFAAGVTVPLSLVGSCAAMWVAGFSIDNLSLMALTIAVGFVVDDAIVMIENIETQCRTRHGAGWRRRSRREADRLHRRVDQPVADRRVHSAAVHGRHRRAAAAANSPSPSPSPSSISTVVSLTVTPMICALASGAKRETPIAFRHLCSRARSTRSLELYLTQPRARRRPSLGVAHRHPADDRLDRPSLRADPQGQSAARRHRPLNGTTEASADMSFTDMVALQKKAMDVLADDPDVVNVGSFIGSAI